MEFYMMPEVNESPSNSYFWFDNICLLPHIPKHNLHFIFQSLQYALKIFNYFFTCVFILEAIVKIVALGVVRYFKDRYISLLDLVLAYILLP